MMLMKNVLFLFLVFTGSFLNAQLTVSEQVINYGEIGPDTDLEKEVFFINTGTKEAFLLTNDFPREYAAHVSSKSVAVGDTLFLRWKFNPFQKGKFSDEITLWFSTMDKPTMLKVKGDVKYIDPYANPACPSFNDRPAGEEKSFVTDFLVLEKRSGIPIKNASIKIVDRGIIAADIKTDRKGENQLKLPIRYFYFLVAAEGYVSADLYSYVNSKNHRFVFELEPLEVPVLAEEVIEPAEEPLQKPEITPLVEENEPVMEEVIPEDTAEFSSEKYAPNNIVFLVDVSGSMNNSGRLEILKASMIELVEMLRPEDKVSLVSYARAANVILPPTSGRDKEEIISEIRNLKAQGATSGEKGLKRAYAAAKSAYITKGNNRVYIATDGVFKGSEVQPINKLVKKFSRRKIYLSVLGVKGTKFTKQKMAELAKLGEGRFVALEEFDTAPMALKELIKEQSKLN